MMEPRNSSESEKFYDPDDEEEPPPSLGEGSTFAFG